MKLKNSGVCANCGGQVRRFRERDKEPYKFCSADCDRKILSKKASRRMKSIWQGIYQFKEVKRPSDYGKFPGEN